MKIKSYIKIISIFLAECFFFTSIVSASNLAESQHLRTKPLSESDGGILQFREELHREPRLLTPFAKDGSEKYGPYTGQVIGALDALKIGKKLSDAEQDKLAETLIAILRDKVFPNASHILEEIAIEEIIAKKRAQSPSETDYPRTVIYLDPEGKYEFTLIAYLPGQRTPKHNHGGNVCCFLVVGKGARGKEVRYRVQMMGPGLAALERMGEEKIQEGHTSKITRKYNPNHEVINDGKEILYEFAIYAEPLVVTGIDRYTPKPDSWLYVVDHAIPGGGDHGPKSAGDGSDRIASAEGPSGETLARQLFQEALKSTDPLRGAAEAARSFGYEVTIDQEPLSGHVEDAADLIINAIRGAQNEKPRILLWGGRTAMEIPEGKTAGRGGRNSHLALEIARDLFLWDLEGATFLIAATGGKGGRRGGSGAVVTDQTYKDAERAGLDVSEHLERFDSATLLEKIGAGVMMGATSTDGIDIAIAIVPPLSPKREASPDGGNREGIRRYAKVLLGMTERSLIALRDKEGMRPQEQKGRSAQVVESFSIWPLIGRHATPLHGFNDVEGLTLERLARDVALLQSFSLSEDPKSVKKSRDYAARILADLQQMASGGKSLRPQWQAPRGPDGKVGIDQRFIDYGEAIRGGDTHWNNAAILQLVEDLEGRHGLREMLQRFAKSGETFVITEFGTGNGPLTEALRYLLKKYGVENYKILATDVNAGWFSAAYKRYREDEPDPRVEFYLTRSEDEKGRPFFDFEPIAATVGGQRAHLVIGSHSIHLIDGFETFVEGVKKALLPGGIFAVQSLNVDFPERHLGNGEGAYLIDTTAGRAHDLAIHIIRNNPEFESYRSWVDDEKIAQALLKRQQTFPAVRDQSYYLGTLKASGFEVLDPYQSDGVRVYPAHYTRVRYEDWKKFLTLEMLRNGILPELDPPRNTSPEARREILKVQREVIDMAVDRLFKNMREAGGPFAQKDQFLAASTVIVAQVARDGAGRGIEAERRKALVAYLENILSETRPTQGPPVVFLDETILQLALRFALSGEKVKQFFIREGGIFQMTQNGRLFFPSSLGEDPEQVVRFREEGQRWIESARDGGKRDSAPESERRINFVRDFVGRLSEMKSHNGAYIPAGWMGVQVDDLIGRHRLDTGMARRFLAGTGYVTTKIPDEYQMIGLDAQGREALYYAPAGSMYFRRPLDPEGYDAAVRDIEHAGSEWAQSVQDGGMKAKEESRDEHTAWLEAEGRKWAESARDGGYREAGTLWQITGENSIREVMDDLVKQGVVFAEDMGGAVLRYHLNLGVNVGQLVHVGAGVRIHPYHVFSSLLTDMEFDKDPGTLSKKVTPEIEMKHRLSSWPFVFYWTEAQKPTGIRTLTDDTKVFAGKGWVAILKDGRWHERLPDLEGEALLAAQATSLDPAIAMVITPENQVVVVRFARPRSGQEGTKITDIEIVNGILRIRTDKREIKGKRHAWTNEIFIQPSGEVHGHGALLAESTSIVARDGGDRTSSNKPDQATAQTPYETTHEIVKPLFESVPALLQALTTRRHTDLSEDPRLQEEIADLFQKVRSELDRVLQFPDVTEELSYETERAALWAPSVVSGKLKQMIDGFTFRLNPLIEGKSVERATFDETVESLKDIQDQVAKLRMSLVYAKLAKYIEARFAGGRISDFEHYQIAKYSGIPNFAMEETITALRMAGYEWKGGFLKEGWVRQAPDGGRRNYNDNPWAMVPGGRLIRTTADGTEVRRVDSMYELPRDVRSYWDGHDALYILHNPTLGYHAYVGAHRFIPFGDSVWLMGGTRMAQYDSEEEAIARALALSEVMTQKIALAGLLWDAEKQRGVGGGKVIINFDPASPDRQKVLESVTKSLGELNIILTGQDQNIGEQDTLFMATIAPHTLLGVSGEAAEPHLLFEGIPPPGPAARGVFLGLGVGAEFAFPDKTLEGKRISLQGAGKVGWDLLEIILEETKSTKIVIADKDPKVLGGLKHYFKSYIENGRLQVLEADQAETLYDVPGDIFIPCATEWVLTEKTIPQLIQAGYKLIGGSANDPIERPTLEGKNHLMYELAQTLHHARVWYAPHSVIGAGGMIAVAQEIFGYSMEEGLGQIPNTLRTIFEIARRDNTSPFIIADRMADNRIREADRYRTFVGVEPWKQPPWARDGGAKTSILERATEFLQQLRREQEILSHAL